MIFIFDMFEDIKKNMFCFITQKAYYYIQTNFHISSHDFLFLCYRSIYVLICHFRQNLYSKKIKPENLCLLFYK